MPLLFTVYGSPLNELHASTPDLVQRIRGAKGVKLPNVEAALRAHRSFPDDLARASPMRWRIERLRAMAARRLRVYERAARRLVTLRLYRNPEKLLDCLRELTLLQAEPLTYSGKRRGASLVLLVSARRPRGHPSDLMESSLIRDLTAAGLRPRALARAVARAWLSAQRAKKRRI